MRNLTMAAGIAVIAMAFTGPPLRSRNRCPIPTPRHPPRRRAATHHPVPACRRKSNRRGRQKPQGKREPATAKASAIVQSS